MKTGLQKSFSSQPLSVYIYSSSVTVQLNMQQRSSIDIQQILEEISPGSALLIDLGGTPDWFTDIRAVLPGDTIVLDKSDNLLQQIANCGQHDIAILNNVLEYLPQNLAGHVISRLRDLYSRRILLLVSIDNDATNYKSGWKDTDLIALGMNQLTAYEDGKHLYEFNILSYKTVPDWLNAKNWANPELWDKYRW